MSSIRRTLSPAYLDRHGSLLPPPQRPNSSFTPLSSSSSASPPHPPPFLAIPMGQKQPRKWGQLQQQQHLASRKLVVRLLLCFIAGLLLGFSPFTGFDDLRPPPDLAFDDPPQSLRRHQEIEISRRPEGIVKLELESKKESVEETGPAVPIRKLLIVVTPTYNRALQAYYLSRLSQTLRLVPPPLLWLVVEMGSASIETAELLRKTGVMYRHLVCKKNSTGIKDRGVHQRNTAIEHIEAHRLDGIVYFADDDNIYTLELFERLRDIRRFGTWPVAMLAQNKNKATLEGPVCNDSQVVGWHTNEKSRRLRRFHVDMSGFAFNSTILWDPKRWHRLASNPIRQLDTVKEGFQETTFIEQVVEDESQMEGLPHGCSRIMNWHLHLELKGLAYPRGWQISRNLDVVVRQK